MYGLSTKENSRRAKDNLNLVFPEMCFKISVNTKVQMWTAYYNLSSFKRNRMQ
jgi:lauroyl/myristoyl acyltransferase